MRPVLSILVVLIAAWIVHYAMTDAPPDPIDLPGTREEAPQPLAEDAARPAANHATLVVHLQTAAGKPIYAGDVGIENGGAIRWVPALGGSRTFTDMPPGRVRILGRAQDRVTVQQRRDVLAGMRTEVRLILRKQ